MAGNWSFWRYRTALRRALVLSALLAGVCATPVLSQQAPPLQPSKAASVAANASGADSGGGLAVSAVAPVVYKDDQAPGSHGYHYTFFGNAFFVNEQGYMLTVAHVVEAFGNGAQAYVLVSRPNAPPGLVPVTVVAKDPVHDVAVLRASPNPFAGNSAISFLPLSLDEPARGQGVLALSLHPKQTQNAHTYELLRADSSSGTILAFEATQLVKSAPASDVFLLSHPVAKGQSGSPVVDAQSKSVIGLVEGLWLRGNSIEKSSRLPTDSPGAAIPVRYAISLLRQNGVSWHTLDH